MSKNKVLLFVGNFIENQPNSWLWNNLMFLTAPLIELCVLPVVITEFIDPK